MASEPLALVTGAAHRLGKSFATVLAQDGYAIGLHHWRAQHEADRTTRELQRMGAQVFPLRADLTDPQSILALFEQVDQIPHQLKVLVNSAGVFRANDPRGTTVADWDLILNLNLRAPFLCAQEAARRMPSGGQILNITDVGARKSWSRFAAYSASKAALEALTGILARAYAPGIRVNAIAPGLILRSEDTSEEVWHRLIERLPLQRAGTLEDLTAAFQFLLRNDYVTGQTLVVDGGYGLVE
jgi:pteridine reductase